MKTVIVNVQIQMDINESRDEVQQVSNVLDAMNQIISISEIESQPQIFVSGIDYSDISDIENGWIN